MKKTLLYTTVPAVRNEYNKTSTGESIGAVFAMIMFFVVLPIAIFIITAGF